jgi:hypothetical protein
VGRKVRATAAHHTQYPIDPGMFPDRILREMFGVEYFVQVLPERDLDTSLFDGPAGTADDAATTSGSTTALRPR